MPYLSSQNEKPSVQPPAKRIAGRRIGQAGRKHKSLGPFGSNPCLNFVMSGRNKAHIEL